MFNNQVSTEIENTHEEGLDAEKFKKVEAKLEAVMVTIGLLTQALLNKSSNTPIPSSTSNMMMSPNETGCSSKLAETEDILKKLVEPLKENPNLGSPSEHLLRDYVTAKCFVKKLFTPPTKEGVKEAILDKYASPKTPSTPVIPPLIPTVSVISSWFFFQT